MKISLPSNDKTGIGLFASLTDDIVFRIVSNLPAADYVALQCVSKSWRDIVSNVPFPHPRNQLPFLLLPPSYVHPDSLILHRRRILGAGIPVGPIVRLPPFGDRHSFGPAIFPLDLPRDHHHLPSLSNTALHVCVGSSHGWLVLLGPTFQISLFNPLTADAITLPPPLSSVSHLFHVSEEFLNEFLIPCAVRRPLHLAALIRLAVLSANPSDGPSSYLLVIVLGNNVASRVITCGPDNGYATWRDRWVHLHVQLPAYGLTDLAFHNGLCLAVVRGQYIAVLDFDASPAFQRILYIGNDDDNNYPSSYDGFLVESDGELLLVKRLGRTTRARISIYKLPPIEGDGPIVPVPRARLRNRALLLGTGNSVSVPAQHFSKFVRGNRVYFTDVCYLPIAHQAMYAGCVYEHNLWQGTTAEAFRVVEEHDMDMWRHLRPFWVTPNLHRRKPQEPQEPQEPRGSISHNNTFILP